MNGFIIWSSNVELQIRIPLFLFVCNEIKLHMKDIGIAQELYKIRECLQVTKQYSVLKSKSYSILVVNVKTAKYKTKDTDNIFEINIENGIVSSLELRHPNIQ
jgi:hypothetical protein